MNTKILLLLLALMSSSLEIMGNEIEKARAKIIENWKLERPVIESLIQGLGDPEFEKRDSSYSQLKSRLSAKWLLLLDKSRKETSDPEIKNRIDRLLSTWPWRYQALVGVYKLRGTRDPRKIKNMFRAWIAASARHQLFRKKNPKQRKFPEWEAIQEAIAKDLYQSLSLAPIKVSKTIQQWGIEHIVSPEGAYFGRASSSITFVLYKVHLRAIEKEAKHKFADEVMHTLQPLAKSIEIKQKLTNEHKDLIIAKLLRQIRLFQERPVPLKDRLDFTTYTFNLPKCDMSDALKTIEFYIGEKFRYEPIALEGKLRNRECDMIFRNTPIATCLNQLLEP